MRVVTTDNLGRYETNNLGKFKAVVYLPYSVTNGKIVEQRALNLPIFVPSPSFWVDFVNDRTATYTPYCTEEFTDEKHPGPHSNSPYELSPTHDQICLTTQLHHAKPPHFGLVSPKSTSGHVSSNSRRGRNLFSSWKMPTLQVRVCASKLLKALRDR